MIILPQVMSVLPRPATVFGTDFSTSKHAGYTISLKTAGRFRFIKATRRGFVLKMDEGFSNCKVLGFGNICQVCEV
jgi:hypothetical protein